MRILPVIAFFLLLTCLLEPIASAAAESPSVFEQSMSDTLELWREGRYEELYEHFAHRGKTSREQFVNKMHDTTIRQPAVFRSWQASGC
jgi:hypothetical protein